jgi:hypothetical protein
MRVFPTLTLAETVKLSALIPEREENSTMVYSSEGVFEVGLTCEKWCVVDKAPIEVVVAGRTYATDPSEVHKKKAWQIPTPYTRVPKTSTFYKTTNGYMVVETTNLGACTYFVNETPESIELWLSEKFSTDL